MLKLLSKLLGLVCLALSVILAILDLTSSIADSKIVLTALGQQWAAVNTTSLQYLQVGIERKLGLPWLWNGIFIPLLQMPGWLVFGILALVFLWLGRSPDRRLRKRLGN